MRTREGWDVDLGAAWQGESAEQRGNSEKPIRQKADWSDVDLTNRSDIDTWDRDPPPRGGAPPDADDIQGRASEQPAIELDADGYVVRIRLPDEWDGSERLEAEAVGPFSAESLIPDEYGNASTDPGARERLADLSTPSLSIRLGQPRGTPRPLRRASL